MSSIYRSWHRFLNKLLDAVVEDAEKNHVLLDENLSFARTGGLIKSIVNDTQAPLSLDASKVRHLDAPCAQILLAAKNHYVASGISFEILNPSDNFTKALSTLGLEHCLHAPLEVS
jgi:anti-anti-sigma regulatory factor